MEQKLEIQQKIHLLVGQYQKLACAGQTDLFFSEKTKDMRAAQMICSSCESRDPCLTQARENPPFAGVWGGVIFVNGVEELTKRGRGRPRKSELLENARIIKALSKEPDVKEMVDFDLPSGNIGKQIA